jgi:hypothetical protein
VFIQQGAQIGGIMSQAGIGVAGLARAVVGMAGAATAAIVTNPILLGIAAAAGTAYGAFKLFQSSVSDSGVLDRYVASLGLTKKELKELGDVVKGTWKTVSDAPNLDKVFSNLKAMAVDAFSAFLSYSKNATAGVYAAFVGTYEGIAATWRQFPQIMGEFAINAANAHISAAEYLANKIIALMDALAATAQKFGAFSDQLKGYRDSLKLDSAFGAISYRTAQVNFMKFAGLAGAGDETGLAGFQGAAQSFLDVSKQRSSTYLQYQRDLASVIAATGTAIDAADARSGQTGIVQLNDTATQINGSMQQVVVTVADGAAATKSEVAALRADINAALLAIAQNTSSADHTLRRWDRGTTMAVTADDPLPVDQV